MIGKRKRIILLLFPFITLFLGMVLTNVIFMHAYQQTAFDHISAFCEVVLERSPETKQQLLTDLKNFHSLTEEEITGNNYLGKYGYRADEFCKSLPIHTFLIPVLLFIVTACAGVFGILVSRKQKQNRILDLTEYLEQVNIGFGAAFMQTEEDDFSLLQDEIYKTVTTLYQTREAAIAAKQNFAENLENIAHQLKTPITASFLSLQLMKQETTSPYADQIERQLERLNRLEEALLMLSQIDAGTLPVKHEKVDLYTVINLAAENLNDLLQKECISVEIPDHGCIEFLGDLEWTMEALINLIKNCMEHSEPGGMVYCDYSNNPLFAEIRIWDDGTGFDPEDLPHLFDRFYRGKRAAGIGIGIGLALAKSIVELQNGTISAYNLQNGGACFEIRFFSH